MQPIHASAAESRLFAGQMQLSFQIPNEELTQLPKSEQAQCGGKYCEHKRHAV
jgi:hypothetical protein